MMSHDSSSRPLCDSRLLLARQLRVSICTRCAVVSKYFCTSKARRVLLARHSSGNTRLALLVLQQDQQQQHQAHREHALSGVGDESSADVC